MINRHSFTQSLMDLSFNKFVTIRVIGVLYAVSVAGISLSALGMFFTLVQTGGSMIFTALVVPPLFWLFAVVMARVSLESLAASIKTSENTARMVEIMEKTSSGYQ
jgi:Domain of unknown function (DUF4282)